MFITIENNTVVVNLDEVEFPIFEAMFANLQLGKKVSVEFRKFPGIGGGRHRPTAKGSDQATSPRNLYRSGSSQASSLSAGFTWESPK